MSKLKKYQMYIDGQWVDAENNKTFETLNPENNEPWAIVPEASAKDTDKAVQAAQKAFEGDEEQRFKYVGPNDNKTREICKEVLSDSQNNKGFTFAEIEKLPVTFTEGGKYNCRHEFVPV